MKFKQAIQIGDNATDILKLPCVAGVWKKVYQARIEGGGIEATHVILEYHLYGDISSGSGNVGGPIIAINGAWLCEDYNGHWHVMTDNEYKQTLKFSENE